MYRKEITINNRRIGRDYPVYIVAEMSANHNHDFEQAKKIIHAAKESGADAVKLQTYTADTLTIDVDNEYFHIEKDNPWSGKTLHELYKEAYTPWEWQENLIQYGQKLDITVFSTPFDETAVEFLEELEVPAYKIASFELNHLPLIKRIVETGKPIIMSTGLATLAEIEEAVQIIKNNDNDLALLHCTSAYPAPASEMNLANIKHLEQTFGVPIGLSDHSLGIEISIASVALGGSIIEKHFTLDRSIKGPDSDFSIEPSELSLLVRAIKNVKDSLGTVKYGIRGTEEEKNRIFRRSIFAVKDISDGDKFTPENVRIIRPGYGLSPQYWNLILKSRSTMAIPKGTPLKWEMISSK